MTKPAQVAPTKVQMQTPAGLTTLTADPRLAPAAPGVILAPAPKRETLLMLQRHDYLTSAVVEVTLEGGREVSRRQLHPPDIARIAVGRALEALERMIEDR